MPIRKPFLVDQHYHVSNFAQKGLILWQEREDFERFLKTILSYLHEFPGISLLAYSILPNEYHFLLKNSHYGLDISKFIRRLQISYVMYFQKKYYKGIKQVLFPERFVANSVKDEGIYGNKMQWVHLAPVYKNIVQHISHWPYTSAHQVADTGYRSQGETHLPLAIEVASELKKKISNRWREDFVGF